MDVLVVLIPVVIVTGILFGLRLTSLRCARRRVVSLLESGRPLRARAAIRILSRERGSLPEDWAALHQAIGLFWCGRFETLLARIPRTPTGDVRFDARWHALHVHALLLEDRVNEAAQLFTARAVNPSVLDRRHDGLVADGAMLSAALAFHRGARTESRAQFAAMAALRESESEPEDLLVRFYLAAIAHGEGDLVDARRQLAFVVTHGGGLFVQRWAADTFARISPGIALPPLMRVGVRARVTLSIRTSLSALGRGVRIAFFRKSALAPPFASDQALGLLVLDVLLFLAPRVRAYSAQAYFLEWNAFGGVAAVMLILPASYLATRLLRRSDIALQTAAAFCSALPLLLLLHFAGTLLRAGVATGASWLEFVVAVWAISVFVFVVGNLAGKATRLRKAAAALVLAFVWIFPMHRVARNPLWIELTREPANEDRAALSDYMFAEAATLGAAETKLLPERPGIDDLYFIGFAGWGDQSVFASEVKFAGELFEKRFDAKGRTLLLANDRGMRGVWPTATRTTLRHALRSVGARMNREDDILFLFLTSHGGPHELGVSVPGAPSIVSEEGIEPAELRGMLDGAGVKWRVLLVSGCHAGVFVDALRDDFTLVATAAAADRNSYGCADGAEFTDFGRAVFHDQLVRQTSLVTAFTDAIATVEKRESAAKLRRSLPQLAVGVPIAAKLERWESRVRALADASSDGGTAVP